MLLSRALIAIPLVVASVILPDGGVEVPLYKRVPELTDGGLVDPQALQDNVDYSLRCPPRSLCVERPR